MLDLKQNARIIVDMLAERGDLEKLLPEQGLRVAQVMALVSVAETLVSLTVSIKNIEYAQRKQLALMLEARVQNERDRAEMEAQRKEFEEMRETVERVIKDPPTAAEWLENPRGKAN